ncbi:MAG: LysE family transporter [Pseudomonadota bacterium]|nr:LysE family transporter [Pseudomonadota bacterium]
MIDYLLSGTVLGLSAGLAPGPLLTLVLLETLQHNWRAGVKVACAPLLTDLPIIFIALFVLAQLSLVDTGLGVISLAGVLLLLFMAYKSLQCSPISLNLEKRPAKSLSKGVFVNFLSPHPYLFWLTVGGPLVMKAWTRRPLSALAFIGTFYLFLIGAKISLALLAGRSKILLEGRLYLFVMRFLGLLLGLLALALFRDALKFFALI